MFSTGTNRYFSKFYCGKPSPNEILLPPDIILLQDIYIVQNMQCLTYTSLQDSRMEIMSYPVVSAVRSDVFRSPTVAKFFQRLQRRYYYHQTSFSCEQYMLFKVLISTYNTLKFHSNSIFISPLTCNVFFFLDIVFQYVLRFLCSS